MLTQVSLNFPFLNGPRHQFLCVSWMVEFGGAFDIRMLNSRSVKDVFPLPLVQECLDTLAGNTG